MSKYLVFKELSPKPKTMDKAYLVTYTETSRKRSVVIAQGEADAVTKFENNEDNGRETLEGKREIESVRYLRREKKRND